MIEVISEILLQKRIGEVKPPINSFLIPSWNFLEFFWEVVIGISFFLHCKYLQINCRHTNFVELEVLEYSVPIKIVSQNQNSFKKQNKIQNPK